MSYIHAAVRPVFTVAIEVDRYTIDTHAGTRSRSRLGSTTTTGTEGRHRTPLFLILARARPSILAALL